MSSSSSQNTTTTTTTTTSDGGRGGAVTTTTNNIRETYWCHECDMSVSLYSPPPQSQSPPLLCPHCDGDFLEQMENPNPNPNSNNLLLHNPPPLPLLSPPQTLTPPNNNNNDDLDHLNSSFQIPSAIRVSDAFLLDRLIQHLDDDTLNNYNNPLQTHLNHNPSSSPASKASVASIPTIKITTSILSTDTILCAVCKDEFLIDVEAKQLPCNHIYHFECILPWLSSHNSCPVCRYRLPVDEPARRCAGTRVISGNLLMYDDDDEEEDEELFGMRSTLRHIARRHRLEFPMMMRSAAALNAIVVDSSSPTQMAQAETSSAGPANSGETVSSWPVEGGGGRVGGGGVGGTGRLDEDGDTVMSGVRGGVAD